MRGHGLIELVLGLSLLSGLGCHSSRVAGGADDGRDDKRVVATVGTEPVYQIQVDRAMQDRLERIREKNGLFILPTPRDQALIRDAILHGLLLDTLYTQPGTVFSKPRAIQKTRDLALANAKAIRDALLEGKSEEEVRDTLVSEDYRKPSLFNADLLSTSLIQPAYKQEAFNTPEGGVSQIIEDPSGGYYVLKVIHKSTLPDGTQRVEADQFFSRFDKEAAKVAVKEEDLANAQVVILDPTLEAIAALRKVGEAKSVNEKAAELTGARGALDKLSGASAQTPFSLFLKAWVTEDEAADPTTGATYEQAEQLYLKAAEAQTKQEPANPDVAFYLRSAGQMEQQQGKTKEAAATYRKALDAAHDNYTVTLLLKQAFTDLNDAEYLAKADLELKRMDEASNFTAAARAQEVERLPGVLAPGANGTEEMFDVNGESKVVQ